jgi:tetratricopeptide (TPR) repeat protein
MPILAAENCYKKGLVALAEGRPAEATAMFEAAMVIERERSVSRPQMRYLSYYGLSLAHAKRPNREAIKACETAAQIDFFAPDLLLNLGKVYLLAGKTTKALEIFERGLRIAPKYKALRIELRKVDRRQPPPISRLSRNHVLNIWLGKMRTWILAPPPKKEPKGERFDPSTVR